MDAEQQKGNPYHGDAEASGTRVLSHGQQQASTAFDQPRALTVNLMEQVCDPMNMVRAYRRVRSNKGSPGVDGMSVQGLADWLRGNQAALTASLLAGTYQPRPVRGVLIPKPGGGQRQLGIPVVLDRLVQQMILQVLNPIFDPTFSHSSYGFRPGRSAHMALQQARKYVAQEGRIYVVDLDLEKFFDRVNHDILMSPIARRIGDKRLLRLIRRFLQAGLMQDGVCVARDEGTPQGGPLSPLLANLLLDDLDQLLDSRGHRFCRYADDCNIYVRSKAAGERVMDSVTRFLEGKLKLRVNRDKSAVAPIGERKFLGHRLISNGKLGIAPKTVQRFKDRVRELTRRNRGVKFAHVIQQVSRYLKGWVQYYRLACCRADLTILEAWLRRKLRCYRLKQCKTTKGLLRFLMQLGLSLVPALRIAASGKGWWRLSLTKSVHNAMSVNWFQQQGLVSLVRHYDSLRH